MPVHPGLSGHQEEGKEAPLMEDHPPHSQLWSILSNPPGPGCLGCSGDPPPPHQASYTIRPLLHPAPAFARKRHFIKCTPHHPARECHLFPATASEAGSSGCLQPLMPQEAGPGPLQVQCLYYITAKQDGALDHLVICSPPLKQSAPKLPMPTLISKMPRD